MKKKIYKSISKDIKFDERWELFVEKALKLIMMIMLVAARQYKLLLPPIITDCMEKVRTPTFGFAMLQHRNLATKTKGRNVEKTNFNVFLGKKVKRINNIIAVEKYINPLLLNSTLVLSGSDITQDFS